MTTPFINNLNKLKTSILNGDFGATGPTGPRGQRGYALEVSYYGNLTDAKVAEVQGNILYSDSNAFIISVNNDTRVTNYLQGIDTEGNFQNLSNHILVFNGITWQDHGLLVTVKGDQGDTGAQGDQGPQGNQGIAGSQGPGGATGPTGPVGEKGVTGNQGTQGNAGPRGESFQIDAFGDLTNIKLAEIQNYSNASDLDYYFFVVVVDGYSLNPKTRTVVISGIETNTTQKDLSKHLIMYNGTTWSDFGQFTGMKGDQGEQGIQGGQGIQGFQGDTGPEGPVGPAGPQGPEGPQGVQGNIGPEGPAGPRGVQGEKGDQGIQGIQGEKGDQGIQGIQGVTGPYGKGLKLDLQDDLTDLIVTSTNNNSNYTPTNPYIILVGDDNRTVALNGIDTAGNLINLANQVIIFNGNEWSQMGEITGILGDTGPIGPQGIQGEKGDQGIQGIQGIQGVTGPQGESFQVDQFGELNNVKVDEILGSGATPYNFYVFVVTLDLRTSDKNLQNIDVGGSLTDLSRHVIAYDGTNFHDYGFFTGMKGDKGDQGDQGIKGDQGDVGGAAYFELTNSGSHNHSVSLTVSEAQDLINGTVSSYTKQTSFNLSHRHNVIISYDDNAKQFVGTIENNHGHTFYQIGLGPTGPMDLLDHKVFKDH